MPHSPLVLAGLVLLILGGLALWDLGLPGAQASPEEAPDGAVEEMPVELGAVSWHRDFAAGVQVARQRDQALLVLFQEVPG